MAEVGLAVVANDFGSGSIGVGDSFDGTGDFVIKAGPATVGVKFVLGFVEWGAAAFAGVGAGFAVVVVFAGKGRFGAFVKNDGFFFGG